MNKKKEIIEVVVTSCVDCPCELKEFNMCELNGMDTSKIEYGKLPIDCPLIKNNFIIRL